MKNSLASLCASLLLLAACASTRGKSDAGETVVLAVVGMTCAVDCPPRVEAALESVEGVVDASVDYDRRSATVRCRGGCRTEALLAALRKQGFSGTPR